MRDALALPIAGLALAVAACSSSRTGGPEAGAPPPADGVYVEAHVPTAARDVERLDAAIRRYAGDRAGRLPERLTDLVTGKTPEGDSYLKSVPADPWGRSFSYAILVPRAGTYDLRSFGPDGLPGTADDVVSRAARIPIE